MENTGKGETKKRRRWPKILLGLVVLLIAAGTAALLFGPGYVRGLIAEKLAKALQRPVSVGLVVFKPLDLSIAVEQVGVKEKDGGGDFAGFSRFFAKFDSASLFKWTLILKSCRLEGPHLHLVRQQDLTYNFSDLIPLLAAGPEEKKEDGGFLFSINNIEITDGRIEFDDVPQKAVQHITGLTLTIPFISNLAQLVEQYVTPVFAAEVNGTPVAIQGKSKPFSESHETSLDVTITGINLPEYLAYLPGERKFTLGSGMLSGACTIFFAVPKGEKPLFQVGGDFEVKDFAMKEMDSDRGFLEFAGLRVELAPSRVLAREFNLNRIALTSPRVNLERLQDGGSLYPLPLFFGENKQGPENQEAKTKTGSPLKMQVATVEITGGAVSFTDSTTDPAFAAAIAPIDLEMQHFSLATGAQASFRLSFKTDAGETLSSEGRLAWEPLMVSGQLSMEGGDIARYAPYYQSLLAGRVGSGRLRLSSGFSQTAGGEGATFRLTDLRGEITGASLLDEKGKELVNLPLLRLSGLNTDFAAASVSAGELLLQDGNLAVRMEKNGRLNAEDFLKAAPPPPAGQEAGKEAMAPAAAQPSANQKPAWKFDLASLNVQNCSLTFEDRKPATPALTKITELNANAGNLSLEPGKSFPLSLAARLNQSGRIEAKGEITPRPLKAKIDLEMKSIALPPFQPYVAEAANLIVKGGEAAVRGALELASQPGQPVQARFRGAAETTRFRALALDGTEEVIRWGSFKLKNIDAMTAPVKISIDEIGLRDLLARMVVAPDRKLNLGSLLKETEQQNKPLQPPSAGSAATSAQLQATPTQVKIKTIAMERGKVDFIDHSVSPSFASSLTDIAGTLKGVDTRTTEPAELDLRALIDGSAPLTITGKLRPVEEDLYADLQLGLSGVDLRAATPYTAKYMGHTTEKGKLSLNLKYLIDKRQLTAENKAMLDQFTLGETVASPDIVDLPFGLAMSLLRNRRGEIHLNLPVTGNLDDPQFSIGGTIMRMITSLLAKAVTSPFALLGALIPEGVDMRYVAFSPGSADITADEAAKLDTLAKALNERPGIKVDLTGWADPESDRQALAEQFFRRLLQLQKARELAKEKVGNQQETEETEEAKEAQVEIKPEEYDKYLLLAYKAAPIERPKNIIGLNKSLPREEMERLLRASIKVEDADLQALANQRANQVREQLIARGLVGQERIFLLAPRIGAGPEEGKPAQRVEMAMK